MTRVGGRVQIVATLTGKTNVGDVAGETTVHRGETGLTDTSRKEVPKATLSAG